MNSLFQAQVQAIFLPPYPALHPAHLQHHCGGLLVGNSGRISEPSIPKEAEEEGQGGQAPGVSPEGKVSVMEEGEGWGRMLLGAGKESHKQFRGRRESLG